jgi:hypothetical protein
MMQSKVILAIAFDIVVETGDPVAVKLKASFIFDEVIINL